MKASFIVRLVIIAFIILCCGYIINSFLKSNPQETTQKLLAQADIQLNGSRPWDITIHDNRTFARVISQGSIGLGESYMEGWWDCPALDQFFYKICRARFKIIYR